jgi:hypothetical protein
VTPTAHDFLVPVALAERKRSAGSLSARTNQYPLAPVMTKSTSLEPDFEHHNRAAQSGTGVLVL